ncbi:MAG: transglutaminase family protein [Sphingobium sp.]|uniref:transglutaminase-like domain-containing protein n=1 Tax=Sphingobium sp. TaxID=1912891 RepID=UPI000C6A2C20|nr:transglutaminase family protein [Sphingobium sp.]MBU0657716.1 transglutaminase family protein [Alphaproteobacteria bacterium]MBA4753463.1 transglutaminase family protein [Sphingobium sp.]MBS88850.1 transglutaminase [Sphingobium sp.]MBU0776523.1 transglutaminase family protein [Alphaproteobacteria bacterium]MBU0868348.1 transglutaminase family protein [Alphaproteobacteria bacterium]
MRVAIEAILDYDFAEPTDVLLAVEAAALPDQRIVSQSHIINNAGPLTNKVGGSGVGRRTWTRTGTGRMLSTYRATVDVERPTIDLASLAKSPLPSLPEDVLPFIWPSRYCEADRFVSFVCGHFPDLEGGALVAALRDWVRDNLIYVPGSSDGTTTAADTFVAQQGVCRDYAHLTAALIRSRDIPARLVSVYALDLDPPDFHAVVEVWLDGAWHIVDSTGLAPVETMVRIAVGRDATDIAFMTAFGNAMMNAQSILVSRVDEG